MSVAIVMPAWNEASGIGEFLTEIHEFFAGIDHTFIVIDDCSTDQTIRVLNALQEDGLPLQVESNQNNLGHGPTTVKALGLGFKSDKKVIVSIDGDGQFLGQDVLKCYREILQSNAQIIEGIRVRDSDPLYRKTTSLATRVLVWSRCREFPKDANTPLRVYQRSTLIKVLDRIPPDSLVPNLMISTYARKNKMKIGLVAVDFVDRRGVDPKSTSWGRSKSYLPSKKFINFCGRATKSWLAFDPGLE